VEDDQKRAKPFPSRHHARNELEEVRPDREIAPDRVIVRQIPAMKRALSNAGEARCLR